MSNSWRRFEVLLPLRFNDGREVAEGWLAEAVLEIVDRFGAASYETQKVEGHWRHGGVTNASENVRRLVQTKRVFVVSDGRFRVSANGLEYLKSLKANS